MADPTVDDLVGFGTALHGHEWQSRLARDLAAVKGAPVSPAQVAHWAKGTRPVPAWVGPALVVLAADKAPDLRDRADRIEVIAATIDGPDQA